MFFYLLYIEELFLWLNGTSISSVWHSNSHLISPAVDPENASPTSLYKVCFCVWDNWEHSLLRKNGCCPANIAREMRFVK